MKKVIIGAWLVMLCAASIANIVGSTKSTNAGSVKSVNLELIFTPNPVTVLLKANEPTVVEADIPIGYGDLGVYFADSSISEYIDFDYVEPYIYITGKKVTGEAKKALEGIVVPKNWNLRSTSTDALTGYIYVEVKK